MTQLDNVVDLGYDKSQIKEPFSMAFCYPKDGPVLIKGARNSVLEYMENHLKGIYHYRLAHWRRGNKRGSWYINKPKDLLLALVEVRSDSTKKYELHYTEFGSIITVATFDEIPHEYITDFDLFQIGI